MTRHAATLLAMAALLAAPAAAQDGIGQVHGTVLDADSKGVVGLPVALVPEVGTVLHGATTDQNGRYAFKGLDAGTYSVVVLPVAGRPLRKDGIRVRALFRSIVDFNLSIEAPSASLPAPRPDPAPQPGDGAISIAFQVEGPDRLPVPDASVALTPAEGAGSPGRARTGADGRCLLEGITPDSYTIAVGAPGFIGWIIGPLPLREAGAVRIAVSLTPFPTGFAGTLEDLLVPADPVPPAP